MTTVNGLDGLKRCPTCKQVPDIIIEDIQHTTIQCIQHGHMAMGADVEQTVRHWNKYISFVTRDAVQNAAEHMSLSLMTSICLFCRVETGSIVHMEPAKYWVECSSCHLSKFEKAA
jgi:hypothetical protein